MTPVETLRDQLIRMELERCSYLNTDASRIRQWRLEDARNGIVWADQSSSTARETGASSKSAR